MRSAAKMCGDSASRFFQKERVEASLVVARRENGLEENGDKSLVRDECRVYDPFHQFARHEFAAALVKAVSAWPISAYEITSVSARRLNDFSHESVIWPCSL